MALSTDEIERYKRHLVLREVGGQGQQKLKAARVLVVGAGGLGSPVLLYLAAAGVGTIGIIDDDRVSLDNLQRQIVHDTAEIGVAKVESARAAIARLNPHVRVETYPQRIDAANALAIIGRYDIVADGSDNFATRYLVS
jgi:adenylyltransferase/sulfurtransferase